MNQVLFHELLPQIRRLLHRDHEPIVTRKLSKVLKNAGNGVFTTTTVLKGEVGERFRWCYVLIFTSLIWEILNKSMKQTTLHFLHLIGSLSLSWRIQPRYVIFSASESFVHLHLNYEQYDPLLHITWTMLVQASQLV